MNIVTRRSMLAGAPSAAAVALLAGCAPGAGLNSPVTVDLKTAQAWAAGVTNTITGLAASLAGQLPANIADIAGKAVSAITAANTAFQAVASGATDVKGLVGQIIASAQTLVGLYAPLFPQVAAVQPSISLGLAVLQAFVAAVAMVPPAVPADLKAVKPAA